MKSNGCRLGTVFITLVLATQRYELRIKFTYFNLCVLASQKYAATQKYARLVISSIQILDKNSRLSKSNLFTPLNYFLL